MSDGQAEPRQTGSRDQNEKRLFRRKSTLQIVESLRDEISPRIDGEIKHDSLNGKELIADSENV